MDRQQYFEELMYNVRARAQLDNDFTESAFLDEVTEMLVDAEEVGDLTPVHFAGRGPRGRRLAVSAYDMADDDDSVALAITDFEDVSEEVTLSEADAKRQFTAVEHFLEEALVGAFQQGREESTPEYELADEVRARGRSVTRYRIYLITNKKLSSRAKDFQTGNIGGIPLEYHIWDVERFWHAAESASGREELLIDLREWAVAGIPALKATSADGATTTYLCVLPARLIADLYGRYGGRLLQGNVRSYLSSTVKVNRGIRDTVLSQPDRFLAYNNGITATASSVELEKGAMTRVTDLQIVNGGQTTASLFYSMRERKQAGQFDEAFVQAKLVVVSGELQQELVEKISRYANSQNKVNEADFFSNSPFHVRLEEISRRLLTPPRPGVRDQGKWFYERTRGQYNTEKAKAKLGRSYEAKMFPVWYPRERVVTKTDAARYAMSWDRRPHIVSTGAQKNFTAFANEITKRWEVSAESFNETYFKHLVAQGILYNDIRAAVARQSWYEKGYLANIVTYTVAKISDSILQSSRGSFNFDSIWQRQGVSEATMKFALDIAFQVLGVLEADNRLRANVTEWAKSEECWKRVHTIPIDMPPDFIAELISGQQVRSARRSAREQQLVDDGIRVQTAVLAIPGEEWMAIKRFAENNRLLRPSDDSILSIVIKTPPGIPSEKQAARLMELKQKVWANGYGFEN
jgi:hypothetical protein